MIKIKKERQGINMLSEMMNYLSEDNIDVDNIQLDAADESAIFLAALQDVCTAEEYNELVMENTTELALFGLIENADIVTEAKKIVYKQTKTMNMNREQAKAALRLAKKANDPLWTKYQKHRSQMIDCREKIFAKYGTKGKTEAKRVLNNSKKKASSANSVTGKTIVAKMDKKISEMEKKN